MTATASTSNSCQTKRILVVEDDQVLARIYWKNLIAAGYVVELATDGLQAVHLAQTKAPDLVVLDLMLPGLNGAEVLAQIRQNPGTAHLPVLLFTNQFIGPVLTRARQFAPTKTLSKTDCPPARLAAEIESLIGPSIRPSELVPPAPEAPPEPPAQRFHREAPALRRELIRWLEAFLVRGNGDLSRLTTLAQHVTNTHRLAQAAGFALTAHFAKALEQFLADLLNDPHAITPAARHTADRAVRCLDGLLALPEQPTVCQFSALTVLVVDDDAIAARLNANALSRVALRSECLTNPLVARQRLQTQTYPLIILDIEMPDLTGPQLCRELRAMPQHAHTPVLFVTAVDEFDRREQALQQGADDLLAKPFLATELAVKALTLILTARAG
ncbi:MAG: response regulator [Verrucomicrobiae bacterium]|nr:response regulator [Verrucomicrobiae bacterium]